MTREGPEGKDVVIKSNKRQTVGASSNVANVLNEIEPSAGLSSTMIALR